MKRISTITKFLNLFGIGKHGFRDGDLANGFVATDFDASWCNHVQEELARVIEASGLALDDNNMAQLLAALSRTGVFQTPAANDDSTRAATTAFVRNTSPASLLANGWQKLPSGLVIQWGTGSVSAQATATFSFPIAFPSAALAIVVSKGSSISTTQDYAIGANALSETQYRVTNSSPGPTGVQGFNFIAIGC